MTENLMNDIVYELLNDNNKYVRCAAAEAFRERDIPLKED